MRNWLRRAGQRESIWKSLLTDELRRRRAASSPEGFRAVARLSRHDSRPLKAHLEAWQLRDLEALDAAWLRLAGRSPPMTSAPTVRRAWIERPRGHSKTTDMAVQLTWVVKHARSRVQGLAAAADREQGALILRAANDLIASNSELCGDLKGLRDSLVNVNTGSHLDVLSSDVASSYGQLPDFVICDELCHWERPDLWYSLLSSAAKKPVCVLAVLTNAGVGQGWQWQAREAARASPGWHFSSLAGSQAPWIDAAALDEQRRLLPPAVFARLWENRWQHSDGEFVTLAEAEACRDDGLCEISRGRPDRFYFAAIDYAEKHDRTVGVVLHVEGDHLIVDRMDVAVPTPDRPVPVQWVEDWIAETARAFGNVRFVVDEYQLLGTIQRLGARHDLKRFAFAAGAGNHALALTLRNLIVERKVRWPAGCGQLPDCESRDDLETELASLVLRQAASGRVRIDHRREVGSHDDRAFALGAACLEGVLAGFQGEWIDVTEGLLQ